MMKTSRFSWEMVVAGLVLTVATALILEESTGERVSDRVNEAVAGFEGHEIPEPPAPPQLVRVSRKGDAMLVRIEGIENPDELEAAIGAKTAAIEEKLAALKISNSSLREALSSITVHSEDGQSVIVLGNLDSASNSKVYEQVLGVVNSVANQISPEVAEAIASEAATGANHSSFSYAYSYSGSGKSEEAGFGNFTPTFTSKGRSIEDVALSTMGGNISITASEDETVRIMVKPGRSGVTDDEVNRMFEVRFIEDGKSIRLEIEPKSGTQRMQSNFGMNIFAKVPGGKQVSGVTKGGNLTVSDFEGRALLSTKGGNVNLNDFSGDLEAVTKGGNIVLADVTGRIEIESAGGNLTLTDVSADLKAHTNGGNVSLNDVSGTIQASTNGGNINSSLSELTGSCDLRTNAGNIEIEVPSGLGANVELRGMDVSIPSIKFEGTFSKTRADGKMNGGGKLIRATTGVGRVTMRE